MTSGSGDESRLATGTYWRERLARAGLSLDEVTARHVQHSVLERFRIEAAKICERRLHTPLLANGEPDFFPVTPHRLEAAIPKVTFGLLAAYLESVEAALADHDVDTAGLAIVGLLTPGTVVQRDGAAADLHEALTAFDWTDVDLEDADVVFADEVASALTDRFGEVSYRLAVEPDAREGQLLRNTASKMALQSKLLDRVLTVGGALQALIERVEGTDAVKKEMAKLKRLRAQPGGLRKVSKEEKTGVLNAVLQAVERSFARARGVEPVEEPTEPRAPEVVPAGPPPSQSAEIDALLVELLRVKKAATRGPPKDKKKGTAPEGAPVESGAPQEQTTPAQQAAPKPDQATLSSFLGRLLAEPPQSEDD